MDEQQFAQQGMNQDAAIMMGRTAMMTQDSQEYSSLLSQLLDIQKDISEIELNLQGLRTNDEGKIEQYTEPKLNKVGAANIIQLMRSMVSQVTAMSNFEEEQVRVLTIELGDDLVEHLTFNKLRYNMTAPKALADIENIVTNKAFAVAMMAKDNGLRQLLRKNIMETTINAQGNSIKSGKGGIGALLGMGKR
jgi:hypothetical protein